MPSRLAKLHSVLGFCLMNYRKLQKLFLFVILDLLFVVPSNWLPMWVFVLAIRNEIDMIETGKFDQYNNPLKVNVVNLYWNIYIIVHHCRLCSFQRGSISARAHPELLADECFIVPFIWPIGDRWMVVAKPQFLCLGFLGVPGKATLPSSWLPMVGVGQLLDKFGIQIIRLQFSLIDWLIDWYLMYNITNVHVTTQCLKNCTPKAGRREWTQWWGLTTYEISQYRHHTQFPVLYRVCYKNHI